jgi:hypothetical protein
LLHFPNKSEFLAIIQFTEVQAVITELQRSLLSLTMRSWTPSVPWARMTTTIVSKGWDCLRNGGFNGPVAHLSRDIWAWSTMVEWCEGKIPHSSTTVLFGIPSDSHLV